MAGDNRAVKFREAETEKLGVKKLVSLDKDYEITIGTQDAAVMGLDAFDSRSVARGGADKLRST